MNKQTNISYKPLVSIITATYNAEESLIDTILSIRAQTYENIEWIIIDGGSTDGTVDLLQKNEDIVAYWMSEPDDGVYDAWNKAIKKSNGDWISFLGAGDTYTPNAITTYINTIFESKLSLDLISSRINLVNISNKSLRLWGEPFDWPDFRKAMKFAHVGALHNRTLFDRFGLFDSSYQSAGDYEFFMRCGSKISALYIDTVTANVLVGGISMNNNVGLLETCNIQIKYGLNPVLAYYYCCLALLKQKVRPLLRKY